MANTVFSLHRERRAGSREQGSESIARATDAANNRIRVGAIVCFSVVDICVDHADVGSRGARPPRSLDSGTATLPQDDASTASDVSVSCQ